ncbi:MAG TPA: malectin domain-containing carbohydrate-binding protein [Desulfuromonadaceae bacterium]|jgi:hypothetical protein
MKKILHFCLLIIFLSFFISFVPLSALAAVTTSYQQSFESDSGGYTADGAKLWAWGAPLNPGAPLKTNPSSKCWGTTQKGTVVGTLEANLYSPTITVPTLGTGQIARVSFNAYIDVNYEQYGEGDFYISTDGKQTWQLLGRFYEKMTESGWQRYAFNISEHSGKSINLRFRAYIQNFDPGFYIDDVALIIEDPPSPAKIFTLEASEDPNPKASCPWVYTWDGKGFVRDNDIYSVGRFPQGEMRDFYLLQKPLVAQGDSYDLEIREVEAEDSWTDQLGLLAIDHHPGVKVAPDNKGNILAYRPAELVKPVAALAGNGSNVLTQVITRDSSGFQAYSNDYIELDFGAVNVSKGARVVLRVKGFNQGVGEEKPFIGPPAILVQALNAAGAWQEVGRLNPRFEWSEAAFDLSAYLPDPDGHRKIRLTSVSHGSVYHEIDFVALAIGSQPNVTVTELALQSASMGDTDVQALLQSSDNQYVNLTSGNKFSASFSAIPDQPGMVREFVLVSEGYYIPKSSTFLIYTWDGTQWMHRESFSFAAADSQKTFNLSSYLPDPSGEYKVRIWQDYANWPAAIDFVGLQVGTVTGTLTSATDLRSATSILTKVQKSDDIRLEYPLDPVSHLPRNRWTEYRWSVAPVSSYTINSSAGAGGSISPSGITTVSSGTAKTFSITPNTGFTVADVRVDGTSVGRVTSYTFSNVIANHTIQASFTASAVQTSMAINCGGAAFTDSTGLAFVADGYYSGGYTNFTTSAIPGTIDDLLYQSWRYGNMSYNIPLANGNYSVTLKFSDWYTAVGKRVFDVKMEGVVVLSNVDIVAKAGYLTPYDVTIPVTVTDGLLNIQFVNKIDNAKINAIVIKSAGSSSSYTISASAGSGGSISPSGSSLVLSGSVKTYTITPNSGFKIAAVMVDGVSVGAVTSYTFNNVTANHTIQASFTATSLQSAVAINCGGPAFTDSTGLAFVADKYYTGGYTNATTSAIPNTVDDALYQVWRYGNFSYNIPVVNGNYSVTLKFSDWYASIAKRVFDVKIEGILVLSNFDIFAKAGYLAPYDVTIPVTVADGMLNIQFINKIDNAKVNAIVIKAR